MCLTFVLELCIFTIFWLCVFLFCFVFCYRGVTVWPHLSYDSTVSPICTQGVLRQSKFMRWNSEQFPGRQTGCCITPPFKEVSRAVVKVLNSKTFALLSLQTCACESQTKDSDLAAGSGGEIMPVYWFTIRISNTSIAEGVAHTFHRTVGGPCDCGSMEGSDRLKNPTVVRGFQSSWSPSRPPDESPVITAVAASSYATQLQLCSLLPISGSAALVRIAWWVGVQRMSADRRTDEEVSSSASAEG